MYVVLFRLFTSRSSVGNDRSSHVASQQWHSKVGNCWAQDQLITSGAQPIPRPCLLHNQSISLSIATYKNLEEDALQCIIATIYTYNSLICSCLHWLILNRAHFLLLFNSLCLKLLNVNYFYHPASEPHNLCHGWIWENFGRQAL